MRRIFNLIVIIFVLLCLFFIGRFLIVKFNLFQSKNTESSYVQTPIIEEVLPKKEIKEITISAIGDCTIGQDDRFAYHKSFQEIFDMNNKDYSYFFAKTKHIFENDDLTLANLETTLTNAKIKQVKGYNFKADPSFVQVFTTGGIDAVDIANNHTFDYKEEGFNETIKTLNENKLPYYGYDHYEILNIKDIKIGLAGLTYIDDDTEQQVKKNIDNAIKYFKENNTNLIIISFHWGIEYEELQNEEQKAIGRYAVDNGADLIIGHSPHILQGIEKYKNKYIVYSLANFVFGGNQNPRDKDTMIFQQTFKFEGNNNIENSIKIIPASMSGVDNVNNYQPVILDGKEKERVLKKILDLSENIDY